MYFIVDRTLLDQDVTTRLKRIVNSRPSVRLSQARATRDSSKMRNSVLVVGATHPCNVPFGVTYEKIGTIQRRLAWPLHKDDTLFRVECTSVHNIYCFVLLWFFFHFRDGERSIVFVYSSLFFPRYSSVWILAYWSRSTSYKCASLYMSWAWKRNK